MNVVKMITRFGEPTKLDTAEYGTLCKVANNLGVNYYIQMSKDSENPTWSFIPVEDEQEALERLKEIQ